MIDPEKFWNDKILTWEQDRYNIPESKGTLLEKIAGHASVSLRRRKLLAKQHLLKHLNKARVVELGCGSGSLAEELIGAGAAHYQGYDIATAAVNRANKRVQLAGMNENITFTFGEFSLMEENFSQADIIFSLGLFDWLSPEQISSVFAKAPHANHLHSISEKRVSPSQLAHRLYVQLSYGRDTGHYRPQYHSVKQINALASPHLQRLLRPIRERGMSFGIFLTTLPPSEVEE